MFPFEVILAALRHFMTSAGMLAVSGGWTSESQWDELTLAVVAFVGFGWSVVRKWNRKQREGE